MVARRLILWGLLALAALPAPAVAAPADLDRSFGGDGIVEVGDAGGGPLPGESGARMAVGPGDDIFVLYSSYPPCDPPFGCTVELTVARFDPDGRRDPSFGSGATPHLVVRQNAFEHDFDLDVGPDGKPVITAIDTGGRGLLVARLDHAGRLDATFGAGGVAQPPQPPDSLGVARRHPALRVQPDGKVLVAAEGGRETASSRLVLARFLPDGAPDPGFGGGGRAEMDFPTQSLPAKVLLGPDGAITVPGPQCCLGGTPLFGQGFGVARFLASGQGDPAWGGGGHLAFPTPGAEAGIEAAAAARDGAIFVGSQAETSTVTTVGNLLKLRPDGSPDRRFGGDGAIRLFTRVEMSSLNDLTVDGSGRLVGVGWTGRISVFRLRADGASDRTFNGGELLVLPRGGSHSSATPYQVDLQSGGRIVAIGETTCCRSKTFALMRLRGGSDRSRCLGKKATVVGTRRADELIGTARRDVIVALAGNDTVRGLSGQDTICGGSGHDRLLGGAGRDLVREHPKKPPIVR